MSVEKGDEIYISWPIENGDYGYVIEPPRKAGHRVFRVKGSMQGPQYQELTKDVKRVLIDRERKAYIDLPSQRIRCRGVGEENQPGFYRGVVEDAGSDGAS